MNVTKVSIRVGGDAVLIREFGSIAPTAGTASNAAVRFGMNSKRRKKKYCRTRRGKNSKSDTPLPLPEVPEIPSAAHATRAASLPYEELSSS